MSVLVFGERAQQVARFYVPTSRPTLIVSPDGGLDALREAVALREHGTVFDLALAVDDAHAAQAREAGAKILQRTADFDTRRNLFELLARGQFQLDGRAQSQFGAIAQPLLQALGDCAALAEHLVVHSWAAYRFAQALCAVSRPPLRMEPLLEEIHGVPDAQADSVILWAPDSLPEDHAPVLLAFEELQRPSYIVARPGPLYNLRTRLISVQRAQKTLQRCALVVDAQTSTPGAAFAFAQRGWRTVATASSGAREHFPEIETYDPLSRRSVFGAIVTSFGKPLPQKRSFVAAKPAPALAVPADLPLTSIIVRTHQRSLDFVRRAIASVQMQTYPNVECLLIKDGEDNTDELRSLAEQFSRARFLAIPKTGVAGAATKGVQEARGRFAGFCDDDDALFPDHVERLTHTLLQSGTLAAFSDLLQVALSPAGQDHAIVGYGLLHVPALEPGMMAVFCQVVGAGRMLFDRRWVAASGPFVTQIEPADDYEMWLRILDADDIVPIGAVTGLYSQFSDRSNASIGEGDRYAAHHARIYELHPSTRPGLAARRAQALEAIRQRRGLGHLPPVVRLDPRPLLFFKKA